MFFWSCICGRKESIALIFNFKIILALTFTKIVQRKFSEPSLSFPKCYHFYRTTCIQLSKPALIPLLTKTLTLNACACCPVKINCSHPGSHSPLSWQFPLVSSSLRKFLTLSCPVINFTALAEQKPVYFRVSLTLEWLMFSNEIQVYISMKIS